MPINDNKESFELKDIEVATLGLVTHGANREDFFMLKSDTETENDGKESVDANEMQEKNQSEMEEKITKSVWQKIVELFKKGINDPAIIAGVDTENLVSAENLNSKTTVAESHSTEKTEDNSISDEIINITEDTLKGENTMPDNEEFISKAEFEKAQTELAEIRAELAKSKERETKLIWVNKTNELGYAPVASVELADHLYAISKFDEKEANWLVDLLKSYDKMLADSGLFADFGTSRVVDESDPVVKAINSGDTKAVLLEMDRKDAEALISRMREDARRNPAK